YYIKNDLLVGTLLVSVLIGAIRFRKLDAGSRVFLLLCIFWFCDESLAYYSAIKFHNNLLVYNIGDLIEIFLICVYFNFTIPSFRKKKIGIIIGIISIVVGIANNALIQSVHTVSNYFLMYEAALSIILSMISLSSFLNIEDKRRPLREVHFWIPTLLMFSWSLIFLLFTIIAFYGNHEPKAVTFMLFLVNLFTNVSCIGIFLFYPKLYAHVR
ncbi:MAG TPA: hypothetical protein VHA52_12405, partial [Candidatus Babeliaceae bacterium]|nr:hypothetical protein [Candidatus Babeliaceae bacterium]